MNIPRKIIFIFLVLFLFISIPFIFYLIFLSSNEISRNLNIWNQFGQYISGATLPIISFFTLIITGYIAYEFNTFQKRQITIELFKEFRTSYIYDSRNKAWEVKQQWNKSDSESYRKAFIHAMIGVDQTYINSIPITKEQVTAVYDLLSIYSLLGTYTNQEKILNQLHYFYYAWWRKFLFEIAREYDNARRGTINNEIRGDKKIAGFDKRQFLTGISYTVKLNNLDKICGFQNLPNGVEKGKSPYDIYIEDDPSQLVIPFPN